MNFELSVPVRSIKEKITALEKRCKSIEIPNAIFKDSTLHMATLKFDCEVDLNLAKEIIYGRSQYVPSFGASRRS